MRGSGMTGERESMAVWSCWGGGMEPGQYLDGNAESWESSCYRRGALESWKAEGFRHGLGRKLGSWLWNDWREGEHGSMKGSRVGDGARAIF